jgi:hypothetical protein
MYCAGGKRRKLEPADDQHRRGPIRFGAITELAVLIRTPAIRFASSGERTRMDIT